MSASSKKKLRNAEQAAKMTEKQLTEQKEAKKLKLYSTLAVVVLAVFVVFAAYVGISRTITNSGIRERNTVALTIGEHEISNAELNYYYVNAVNEFYSQNANYAGLFGLDMTKPLNENIMSEETGETWADYFVDYAIENIKATYALVDEAKTNGYTLPEEAVTEIDNAMATMKMYAAMYGYTDAKSYLKAMYGNGTTEEGLRNYYEMTELANHYQQHYQESLTYTADELAAADAADSKQYNSYYYNYYYLNVYNFIEGDNDAASEYTPEQTAAAVEAAEAAAKSLVEGSTTVEELDAAIAALPVNAENPSAASYVSSGVSYSSINSLYADWVADESRKAGDITYVASTSTDGNGNETVAGYYVVMFGSKNDNTYPLANVRHILVAFEGGTYDSTYGTTTYSDEEKAAAWEAAEAILNEWKAGEATEESFAALANEKSADGDGTTGGLYEDIYPGQMVAAFEDWCFADHEVGDTGIVETEYGCHVMFYAGDSETTYRNHLISNKLTNDTFSAWYTELTEAVTVEKQNCQYLSLDLVLSPAV